jgi:DNA-binding transcriptional MerR regulator
MTGKLWLKIGEAAKLLAVSPKELRYWESVIPEIRPRRSKGNLRYYHREELPRLERIRDWLGEGLTVADCQQLLLTGQLKRGLGLEIQPTAEFPPAVAAPAKPKAAPLVPPRIEQARQALSDLLERLNTVPRPLPRKRKRKESAAPEETHAPETPAPKDPKSRKKPHPEPGEPTSFGPLFDQA